MKLRVLFGFACVLCLQFNSISQAKVAASRSNLNPANSWEGIWNYGNFNFGRKDDANYADDLSNSDATTGNIYQANSSPGSNYYVQNQGNAVAYPYHYPQASISQGYYSPGGWTTGWDSEKPETIKELHGGLEEILDGILELDKGGVLESLVHNLDVKEIKGAIIAIKLGFLFLIIGVPLLLLMTVPLSALLVIIILSIPIPTWPNKIKTMRRSLASTSEILTHAISADECLERLVCNLNQIPKENGKKSLINRITGNIKTWKKSWSKKVIPGAGSSKTSCEQFLCSPTKIFKKLSKSFE